MSERLIHLARISHGWLEAYRSAGSIDMTAKQPEKMGI